MVAVVGTPKGNGDLPATVALSAVPMVAVVGTPKGNGDLGSDVLYQPLEVAVVGTPKGNGDHVKLPPSEWVLCCCSGWNAERQWRPQFCRPFARRILGCSGWNAERQWRRL